MSVKRGANPAGQIQKTVTRRDFLRGTTLGAASLAFGVPVAAKTFQELRATYPVAQTARVVLVRDADVLNSHGECNPEVLARMLDEAVTALFDTDDVAAAWQQIFKPEDVLGIKSNVWPPLPTPPELEKTLHQRALDAGIPDAKISIADRGILDDPVFQKATALINARPLRTHHWSGIGGCLKNYIMFVREPWQWHDDACADLGGLWHLPVCRGKTRLNVLVVLTPLFHGIGPHHYDPQYVWPYKGLLVGTDPVALDAIGVKLLAEKRQRFFDRPPRGGTSSQHVQLAETRHGVGVADLDRIEIVRLGWLDGALI